MTEEIYTWAKKIIAEDPDAAALLLAQRTHELERHQKSMDAIRALSQNLDIAVTGDKKKVEWVFGRKIECDQD